MQPSWYQNKCTVQQCYKHTKLLHIGMMALIGRHYYFDDVRDTKYFHTHKNTWMIHQTKHVYPFFYSGIRASPKNFRDTISTQSIKCPASAIHQHQPPRVLPSLCSYLLLMMRQEKDTEFTCLWVSPQEQKAAFNTFPIRVDNKWWKRWGECRTMIHTNRIFIHHGISLLNRVQVEILPRHTEVSPVPVFWVCVLWPRTLPCSLLLAPTLTASTLK